MNRHERRKLESVRRGQPALLGVPLEHYARTRNFRVPDAVTTLEDMVRTASLMAEHVLEQDGGFNPFWLVDCPEGLWFVGSMNYSMETGEDKDYFIAQIRELFRTKRVHRFASAVEGWSSVAAIEGGQRPSEAPDRKEVVYIHGEDGINSLGALRDVVRADDGKPHLTAFEIDEAFVGEGRFTGLLPARPDRSKSVH
jgi:hypothetical protein